MIQPIKGFVQGAKDKRICTVINNLEKYIKGASKHWAGTQQEYQKWAHKTMMSGIKSIADRIAIE